MFCIVILNVEIFNILSFRKRLQVLLLSHPRRLVRDTARFRGLCPHRPRALAQLAAEELGYALGFRESGVPIIFSADQRITETTIIRCFRQTQMAHTSVGSRSSAVNIFCSQKHAIAEIFNRLLSFVALFCF